MITYKGFGIPYIYCHSSEWGDMWPPNPSVGSEEASPGLSISLRAPGASSCSPSSPASGHGQGQDAKLTVLPPRSSLALVRSTKVAGVSLQGNIKMKGEKVTSDFKGLCFKNIQTKFTHQSRKCSFYCTHKITLCNMIPLNLWFFQSY